MTAQTNRRQTDPDLISIVAPAYNEEEGLGEFARRIDLVMSGGALPYEIVFVNDGSTDRTLAVMQSLRAANANITVVNLSRNFGKEIAMTAGIAHAVGGAVVIIDTDLQDPPEVIPEMVDGVALRLSTWSMASAPSGPGRPGSKRRPPGGSIGLMQTYRAGADSRRTPAISG